MYLLFDIGKTNTRIAISKDGATLLSVEKYSTPDQIDSLYKIFEGCKVKYPEITAAAGCIAGPLDIFKSKLIDDGFFTSWKDQPIKERLQGILNVKVNLENDAASAGLGEATFGAGKSYKIVAYITVSTGLGGCRIVNGEIDKASFGFEPGWQLININGELRDIGGYYLSGTAMKREYNLDPIEIKDSKIWEEQANRLAFVLNNIIVLWSPDSVVLGGGIILNSPLSLDLTLDRLGSISRITKLPSLQKAALGDNAGLYGALALIK